MYIWTHSPALSGDLNLSWMENNHKQQSLRYSNGDTTEFELRFAFTRLQLYLSNQPFFFVGIRCQQGRQRRSLLWTYTSFCFQWNSSMLPSSPIFHMPEPSNSSSASSQDRHHLKSNCSVNTLMNRGKAKA